MLGFFRRLINSRVGVFVTLGFVAVIALAFAAGDVTGLSSGTGILSNDAIRVGNEGVSTTDLRRQAEQELRVVRQQQPTATMASLVQAGLVDSLVARMVNGLAFFNFGRDQGMAVSPALIGSELQTIPAFQNATGQFDQATYERAIATAGQTDAQVQRDVARQQMAQFLIVPTIGAGQMPRELAKPYAALLLERRTGQIALIPSAPSGPAPSAQDVKAWYDAHLARYTIPERRIARYAIVTPASVAARAQPTDADIAQAYRAAGARFQAKQVRDVTIATVLTQAGADALAAKVKGGQDVAAAARTAGLEPRTLTGVDKAALAAQTSPAFADAAFAAGQGAAIGPVRGTIGFVVGKVARITDVPGKTLEQARAVLLPEVAKRKAADALSAAQTAIDDSLSGNANIGEIAADQKLSLVTTAPLLPNGSDPTTPGTTPDPALAPIMAAAFGAEEGDTPTLAPIGQDGSFAVVALDRIVRPTPIALDTIRARVTQDLAVDRAGRAARTAAETIAAKAARGVALSAAVAQANARGQVQPVDVTRAQISNAQGTNPVLAALFAVARGRTRALPLPDGRGWAVVKLDTIVPGDAAGKPEIIDATRGDLARVVGEEYVRQFANAVANTVGVKRDTKAIAQLKKDLVGQPGGE